jgi:hypothetical protein
MGDIENTAPSTVACWTVFTELLPGNALMKSVTIYICMYINVDLHSKKLHSQLGVIPGRDIFEVLSFTKLSRISLTHTQTTCSVGIWHIC